MVAATRLHQNPNSQRRQPEGGNIVTHFDVRVELRSASLRLLAARCCLATRTCQKFISLYMCYNIGIALYAIISLLVSHISISYILVLISLCMLYMRILLTVWSRINPYELYIMNASRCMFYIQLVIFY